jgi:hypothetical protein
MGAAPAGESDTDQADDPPLGFVEVRKRPFEAPTATHTAGVHESAETPTFTAGPFA